MSNPSEFFARHKKLFSYLLVACLLITSYFFLSFSRMVKDVENRWQGFFYDVRMTLPIQHSRHPYSIYLIELDDRSLPEDTCRSPVSNIWISELLKQISQHQPAAIGLNILLQESEPALDNNLAGTIGALENVVLLTHPAQPLPDLFKTVAKSWGSMVYKTNSAGEVQFVCSNSKQNDCLGIPNIQRKKVFFKEILQEIAPKYDLDLPEETGWLKLFFQYSANSLHQSQSSKPWTTLSASELKRIPQGALAKDAVFLVGTNFSGLYQNYKLPIDPSTAGAAIGSINRVSDLELSALVLDMALNKTFIHSVPSWLIAGVLVLLLGCIAVLSWNNTSFLHFWLAVFFVVLWNLVAALGFAVYLLEIPCLLPGMLLFLFSLYCLRYQQLSAKIESYQLKYQLEKERFNGLVDRFHSHSVFNALEHIRYLVRKKDNDVDRYILDYSTLLLDDLRHHPQQWYPLQEQWDYTINYLELQNMKFGKKIDLCYDLSPSTATQMESTQLPWKLFFPLAENAFKYTKALADSSSTLPPFIKIALKVDRLALTFSISNSFYAAGTVSGSQQGISNLKKRLSLLFPGNKWRLEQSGTNSKWNSMLEVPLKSNHQNGT